MLFPRLLWDHPRAYGEHNHPSHYADNGPGSSPRLRGTRTIPCRWPPRAGIIPALTGNTSPPAATLIRRRDHPRAYGEHYNYLVVEQPYEGSSPRLRGTPWETQIDEWALRDHPRAYGEHNAADSLAWAYAGSSPRLRGTRRRLAVLGDAEGIIPALTGNTHAAASHWATTRDHPRAYGEHSLDTASVPSDVGSSPRLRGTLFHKRFRLLK